MPEDDCGDTNNSSGDTVHGNQINGDVHNHNGSSGDPSGWLGMDKYSAGALP